jgi:acetylornithine deacetylase/succinyl-diaminopimelate desuccinylase-like protein
VEAYVADKGLMGVRLTVRGTSGHASIPYGVDNALVKAAFLVEHDLGSRSDFPVRSDFPDRQPSLRCSATPRHSSARPPPTHSMALLGP